MDINNLKRDKSEIEKKINNLILDLITKYQLKDVDLILKINKYYEDRPISIDSPICINVKTEINAII